MKLAILFSGGKDSCLALHKVLQEDNEVLYLLNVFPDTEDSFMFHKPNLKFLKRQSKELGIELIVGKSKGEKEKELEDLKKLIEQVQEKVEGIVVGGIASSYQGDRIKKICDELGLKFIAPLWEYSPENIWEELLNEKFEIVLTKVSCEGIGKEWIGRKIGKKEIEELKKLGERYKFRIDFEGGEAESAVLFMPEFKSLIKVDFDIKSDGDYRHFMKIKGVK